VRRPDVVRVETERGGFDSFNRLEIVTDLLDASQATLDIGDDGSWRDLERIVAPGQLFRVYVNDLLQLTGRAEVNEVPVNAAAGTVVQLIVRTKMADARYASADPAIRFKDQSIKSFILALYAQHGYGPQDFAFAPAADRDLVTGRKTGAEDPVDLEPLKADQQKVNPPETTFACAERVLRRQHLMHWDGADGRILVGRPDDQQSPLYTFRCKRGAASSGNNVIAPRRVLDWSEVPSEVWVYGSGPGRDVLRASLRGVSVDLDLAAVFAASGHFNRRVILPVESARTQAQADAQARRERASRSLRKDAWSVELDGWTFWDGRRATPLAINTTVDVDVDTVGGSSSGRYLISRLTRSLDADGGFSSNVELLAPGVLEL
jgi:hypothetical protein